MLTDSAILRHIARQPKQTASHKQLLRELGARGEVRRELTNRLYALVSKGELLHVEGERYAIPHAAKGRNLLVGRLTMHRDRVLVEVTAVRTDGRAEGRIIRSVARAHPTVVGIFHYGKRHNYVKPIDEKVTQEIVIPPGMEFPKVAATSSAAVVEVLPSSRDRVIGGQAAVHTDWTDLDGLVVDVEITDWPSATQNPRGRVIEILGEENDFGVDVEIMIRKFHLPHRFPPEVIEEAQALE